MEIFYILAIIFVVLGIIIRLTKNNNAVDETKLYLVKTTPMTTTEKNFFKVLNAITNKYELMILPQVQLQAIFQVINKKNYKAFNKIKAKSIDFAIVDKDYNYKCFIELDDYTHNRKNRIARDEFVNNLFNKYNLKLKRIKVSNKYNEEELENMIKEVANN